jgi:hypothetical protein
MKFALLYSNEMQGNIPLTLLKHIVKQCNVNTRGTLQALSKLCIVCQYIQFVSFQHCFAMFPTSVADSAVLFCKVAFQALTC